MVSLLLVLLAAATWRRRKEVKEAAIFAFLLISGAIYTFGYSGEVAQTVTSHALFWLHVEYLGIPWVPGFWILATCRHNSIKVSPVAPFLIPVLTFVGHFTNLKNLFYSGPAMLVYHAPFWVLEIPRGPLYKLYAAYLIGTFLCGAGMYLSGLRNGSPIHRKQSILLVMSSIVPVTGYLLYLADMSPKGLDITPFTLSVSAVLTFRVIRYAGIFDLVPLARGHVFLGMRDAVLILDTRGRLMDFNPAAGTLLPFLSNENLGARVQELFPHDPELCQALLTSDQSQELRLGADPKSHHFEVRTFKLLSGEKQLGCAAILSDITSQVHLREELRRLADTDSLTGVANRRRFVETLEKHCEARDSIGVCFSLLLLDLDHFKAINDCYGHPAGDEVLCSVTKRLQLCIRPCDLLGRLGGEEFAILLPDICSKDAGTIAERIRTALAKEPVRVGKHEIRVTASIGVTSYAALEPTNYDALLKSVDTKLYQAKENGRNQVVMIDL